MGIREEILEKIRQPQIRAKIVLASEKSLADSTVVRWIKNNDDCLTKDWCLTVIETELKMKRNDILQKPTRK